MNRQQATPKRRKPRVSYFTSRFLARIHVEHLTILTSSRVHTSEKLEQNADDESRRVPTVSPKMAGVYAGGRNQLIPVKHASSAAEPFINVLLSLSPETWRM